MTPLKQRILDIVQRAGVDGIPAEDLFAIVYDGALPRYHGSHADWARKREALKANIWGLNQDLRARGKQIRCSDRNPAGCYRLVNVSF
jgi:hypothetical protein